MQIAPLEIGFFPPENTPSPSILIQKINELSGLELTWTTKIEIPDVNEENIALERIEIFHTETPSIVKIDYMAEVGYILFRIPFSKYLHEITLKAFADLGGQVFSFESGKYEAIEDFPIWIDKKWADSDLPKYVRHLDELHENSVKIIQEASKDLSISELSPEDGEKELMRRLEIYEKAFYEKYE